MSEMIVVLGGSGSGKSEYAEGLLSRAPSVTNRYYLATMQVYDEDGRRKVDRHRRLRQGKGFETIERPRDVGHACQDPKAALLLECTSNLVANEMFQETVQDASWTVEKVCADLEQLRESVGRLIVVTNNVFEEGESCDPGTREYVRALAQINGWLTRTADRVVEVVVGIPIVIKGESK